MIFAKSVTTPKNTVAATPSVTSWNISQGLIYKFELYFPPGSCGLVGVALHDATHRIYPTGENEYFIGDNVTISFDDEMIFEKANGELEIWTYNLDTYYEHLIQVRLGITDDEETIKTRYSLQALVPLVTELQTLITLLTTQTVTQKSYSKEIIENL